MSKYRDQWNADDDHRRDEYKWRDGVASSEWMVARVTSSISVATATEEVDEETGDTVEVITPSTFTVKRTELDDSTPFPKRKTVGDDITVPNYDLSLKYALPSDPKKAAMSIWRMIDGVWHLIWIGC